MLKNGGTRSLRILEPKLSTTETADAAVEVKCLCSPLLARLKQIAAEEERCGTSEVYATGEWVGGMGGWVDGWVGGWVGG